MTRIAESRLPIKALKTIIQFFVFLLASPGGFC